MRVSPGWGWLLLPVCRALVAPREVSGRLGETLSVQCWYARGYERYNKYWCRGASRDSCRKVVETAGLEAPQRRGRVSITDKQVFCVILLTVEHLSEEDAGSYWCGIERLGKDIMEPVKVAVFPGKSWRHAGLSFLDQEPPLETTLASSQQGGSSNPATPVLTQYKPATSAPLPTTPAAQTPVVSTVMNSTELPNTTNATSPGSSRTAMTIVVPSVVLASLLVAAGSAVLIWTLVRRRKEAQQRPLGDASRSWQDKLAAGSQVKPGVLHSSSSGGRPRLRDRRKRRTIARGCCRCLPVAAAGCRLAGETRGIAQQQQRRPAKARRAVPDGPCRRGPPRP
nr:PREDICTED: CMRF35-like molecule 9 [Apteryx mantelli mantelli]